MPLKTTNVQMNFCCFLSNPNYPLMKTVAYAALDPMHWHVMTKRIKSYVLRGWESITGYTGNSSCYVSFHPKLRATIPERSAVSSLCEL